MIYRKLVLRVVVALILMALLPSRPLLAGWEIKAVRLKGVPEEIVLRKKGRGLYKVRVKSQGIWLSISECGVKLCADPSRRGLTKGDPPRNGLPDGPGSTGKNDIRRAWLSGPTRRYSHGILGDDIDASALSVIDRLMNSHVFRLPLNEVFEDRYARITDLDGDKSDEIVTVLSSLNTGASLAVF